MHSSRTEWGLRRLISSLLLRSETVFGRGGGGGGLLQVAGCAARIPGLQKESSPFAKLSNPFLGGRERERLRPASRSGVINGGGRS